MTAAALRPGASSAVPVAGEPDTDLPADPGADERGFQVHLANFEGPFDLLLTLISKHQLDVTEEAVLTAIAGYTAQAIERALHLDDRITVARQLQQAMLTELPDVLRGLDG